MVKSVLKLIHELRTIILLILIVAVCLLPAACAPATTAGTTAPAASSASGTTAPAVSPTPSPIPSPSPSPTPTPAITDPAQLVLDLASLPGYVADNGSQNKSFANGLSIRWSIFKNGRLTSSYEPAEIIAFGNPETYTDVEGVLAFRGNNYRNAPAWGTAEVNDKQLEIVWTEDIGSATGYNSYWLGAGWTGQPLLVHWPEETRQIMGINEDMKQKDLVEVIYPVFDGNVYFLDLETGVPTRDPISTGFTFKGTGVVDPRGYPLFFAGQGLNDTNGRSGAFKYRFFSLIENKEIFSIIGDDSDAYHNWGAFDSSALVNWQTDTLFEAGENGLFYKVKLNTNYNAAAGTISIEPEITKLRFSTPLNHKYGMESSMAIYRNLAYFCDNDGAVVCIDINTLEPIWVYNAGDDTDATVVIEETADGVYLYIGNTMDHRQDNGGNCQLFKLNALTGEKVWEYDIPVVYDSNLNAGLLATPLVGTDDFADIVIFNVCKTTGFNTGNLIALNKVTGKEVWNRTLDAYSWSSPIAIKSDDGKSYGVFCDSVGMMHLFDPLTGKDYSTLSLGSNCEASPSAYNNMIVVATYSCKIYGIKIS